MPTILVFLKAPSAGYQYLYLYFKYPDYIQSKSTRVSYSTVEASDIHSFGSTLSLKFACEATFWAISDPSPGEAFHTSSLSGMEKDKSARDNSSPLVSL